MRSRQLEPRWLTLSSQDGTFEWLLTGNLPVVAVLPAEEHRAKEILARHVDKDWTLCDAITFAVLDARRLSHAFTFDHHFKQYGRIQVLGLE